MPDARFERAKQIIMLLQGAASAIFLYSADHPYFDEVLSRLRTSIQDYQHDKATLIYDFDHENIFLDHELLAEESLACGELVALLLRNDVNRLIFHLDLTESDLKSFLKLLVKELDHSGANLVDELRKMKITRIEAKKMVSSDRPDIIEKTQHVGPDHLLHYEQSVQRLAQLFDQACNRERLALNNVLPIATRLMAEVGVDEQAMLALTSLKTNEYLCHHSINVAILSLAQGRRIGLGGQELTWLVAGALLHDIGKADIPRSVLEKPSALSNDERDLIRRHPEVGAQMITSDPDAPLAAAAIALEHHIGADSSGYPDSGGHAQHIFARLVQIADTYDALTSNRPNRAAYLPVESMGIMLEAAGRALDPTLLKLFMEMIGIYPSGSIARLSSGQLAIIRRQNARDLLRPIITVAGVDKLDLVDLSKQSDVSISELVDPESAGVDLTVELGKRLIYD